MRNHAGLLAVAGVALGSAVLAWHERGSILPRAWLAVALLTLLLLAVVLVTGTGRRPVVGALAAVAALVGLAAVDALSLLWAPSPALARDEALLVVWYAAILAVPMLVLPRRRDRTASVATVTAVLGGLAVAAAATLVLAPDLNTMVSDGRVVFPVSYVNAQAALALVGVWPAVLLAARAELPVAGRALALGAAGAMLASWLGTQSKGGAAALAVSAVVVVALVPGRLRLAPPIAILALLAGSRFDAITAPYRATSEVELLAAVESAGRNALVVSVVAAAAGFGLGLADRRIRTAPAALRRLRTAGTAACVVLGVALAGITAINAQATADAISDGWHDLTEPSSGDATGTHFTSLGSDRTDLWRVGLDAFGERPLVGVGARGFRAVYLREGDTNETPARAHSLPVDVLAETGLVGSALLAAALGSLGAVLLRRRRDLAGAAAIGAGTLWLAQASIDWTWTVPAATVPALLFLGIGVSGGLRRTVSRRAANVTAAAAAVVALAAMAPTWLAGRLTFDALTRPDAPAAAQLRWARRLDPLSTEPLTAESALAPTPAGALAPLRAAVRKEPETAGLRLVLGVALLRAGRQAEAREQLEEARRLAPNNPFIRERLRAAE